MEGADETVKDGALGLSTDSLERKLSDVSIGVDEKRSDATASIKASASDRKLSKSASEEVPSPSVVKRGSKADPKTKEEKKKKRKSIVSFAGRHYGFRKKDSSVHKSSDKDDSRTPPAGSPSSSPMAHMLVKTLDEVLVAPVGEPDPAAQGPEAPGPETVAEPQGHIYDSVPLSPVVETPPDMSPAAETPHPWSGGSRPAPDEQDGSLQPTVSQQREAAMRAALGLPPVSAERWERARRAGLAWLPDGLAAEDVDEFWPPPEEVPWTDSAGARLRQESLLRQVPAADLRRPDAGVGLSEFAAARDRVALAEGSVLRLGEAASCSGCGLQVPAGRLAVTADLLPAAAWHPACFRCATCRQRLADLLYCHLRGQPLCVRHFGDQLKDRCAACDQLIFDGEFLRAGGQSWHRAHLVCVDCGAPLADGQFGLHGSRPYCLACYESASLGACDGCGRPVRPSSRRLQYGDHHWHPACFLCGWCAAPLEGRQFALREGRVVCADCSSQPAPPPCPRCDVCGLPVAADSGLVEYAAGRCHDSCFVCCVCDVPLGQRTFMPKEQQLYCSLCYEQTFASRCAKCGNTITSLGLTYQGDTWHRECFLCTVCKTTLAGRKFRTHEKKPYCKDCYRDTFGKRCSRCHGVLEGRYSAFQNRSWHNNCFTCVDCGASLVGTGFIDIDGDVLCQPCAMHRQTSEMARQRDPPEVPAAGLPQIPTD
ncbi:Four and a half LIM domains protein 2 [Amphibalanus amphitrite]|uniref:Four and a half LIM domains protein 2 n=1 Tax=Amphibalanus amphitrite TaxID=1232801 RepID=A0A6A4VI60_AMPAM|nr:Four and a half LIM domains protein 2 [Amphibalanus amphitrite]